MSSTPRTSAYYWNRIQVYLGSPNARSGTALLLMPSTLFSARRERFAPRSVALSLSVSHASMYLALFPCKFNQLWISRLEADGRRDAARGGVCLDETKY